MPLTDQKLTAKLACLATLMVMTKTSNAYGDVDYLVFPEVGLNHEHGASFTSEDITPSLNFFASGEVDSVLILSEAYVSERIQHFERIQVGFKSSESSKVWFGRYHNPFGYWHTQYHHGNFLQTSISRPALVEFGAAGGIMPSHLSGALFEGFLDQGESGWKYAFGGGLSSQIRGAGSSHHGGDFASLHDFEPFQTNANKHSFGYSIKLSYLPDVLGDTELGGFYSHARLTRQPDEHDEHDVPDESTEHMDTDMHTDMDMDMDMDMEHISETNEDKSKSINLDVMGVFVNYYRNDLRVIAELYYFNTEVPLHSGIEKDEFTAAYIQAEYNLTANITPFARIDTSTSDKNNLYLNILDGFARESRTTGLRWDLSNRLALKIEYSQRQYMHAKDGIWRLNWTGVWP